VSSMPSIAQSSPVTQPATLAPATNANIGPCSGDVTLTAGTGVISDGNGDYPQNANCAWTLQTSSATTITFTAFSTETNYDFVKIYVGVRTAAGLRASLSGTSLPSPITLETGPVFIVFSSDSSVQASGFLLTFRSGVTMFSGPPPAPSTTLSLAPADGSQTPPRCSGVQIIRSNLGVVSDGAGDYSPGTACSWNFDRSLGRTVSISFTSFDIESGYDFVKIYDGAALVQSFTGSSVPPSFRRTLSDSLSIRFNSDSSVQASGFIAQYTFSAEVHFTLTRLLC
jgi:hypothetical protein